MKANIVCKFELYFDVRKGERLYVSSDNKRALLFDKGSV
jgi:hypothetical protein